MFKKDDVVEFLGDENISPLPVTRIVAEVLSDYYLIDHPDGIPSSVFGYPSESRNYHMASTKQLKLIKTNINNMKKFEHDDVLDIATVLIHVYGSTTTLEVKEELRKVGYKAFQKDVSRHMRQIAQEENLKVEDCGIYSKYSIGTTPSTGEWEMNSTTNSQVLFLPGSLTRDQARQKYCDQTGVKWAETRGRKVK